jgi:hypothetical protein
VLIGVSLLVVATVHGPVWGWGATGTVVMFAVAAVAIALTVLRTLWHPHALIEKTLFRSYAFTTSSIAMFWVFVSFAAWLLITVLFFEGEWHYSALPAGLAIAPGPAVTVLVAPNAGRLVRRFRTLIPAAAGTLVMGGSGLWWYFLADSTPGYLAILPALLLAWVASGLTQAPLLAAVGTVAPERATTASAMLNMSRQIGSAVGVAVLVALLATNAPHELSEFRRGWLLMAGAGWAALLTILIGAAAGRRA